MMICKIIKSLSPYKKPEVTPSIMRGHLSSSFGNTRQICSCVHVVSHQNLNEGVPSLLNE